VDTAELRRVAEEQLAQLPECEPRTAIETLRISHELDVYKIELEMQYRELSNARDDMESMLEKYTDFFEFAPISYFILDCRNVSMTLRHLPFEFSVALFSSSPAWVD